MEERSVGIIALPDAAAARIIFFLAGVGDLRGIVAGAVAARTSALTTVLVIAVS